MNAVKKYLPKITEVDDEYSESDMLVPQKKLIPVHRKKEAQPPIEEEEEEFNSKVIEDELTESPIVKKDEASPTEPATASAPTPTVPASTSEKKHVTIQPKSQGLLTPQSALPHAPAPTLVVQSPAPTPAPPAPVSMPVVQALATTPTQAPAPPTPATTVEEEEELSLNPQLVSLLQYLSDDEKIYMVKESTMRSISQLIVDCLKLKQSYTDLCEKLENLNKYQAAPPVPVNVAHPPQPHHLAHASAPHASAPHAPAPPQKGNSLLSLINNYKSIKEAQPEQTKETGAFFDTTYVLNINGKGEQLLDKLVKCGVENCTQIESIQKKVNPEAAPYYFMNQAIEDAIENKFGAILLISDESIPHKQLLDEFNELNFPDDWDIVQLGSTRKINGKKTPPFDWRFYTSTYTDLKSIKTEKEAEKHWKTRGQKEGRVGCREVNLDEGCNNTFAFALNSRCFSQFKSHLRESLNNGKNPMIGFGCKKYSVSPCLFIQSKHKPSDYIKSGWFKDSYITD
jgi:hypothetical protein